MIRVALRGLAARRLRTCLTALAIVLGVAMVSAAFTLTDTMRGAADSLSSAAYDGTDGVVTAKTAFKAGTDDWSLSRPTVDAALLAKVRSVGDVAVATGDISDEAKIVGADGKTVGDGPYFGAGWSPCSSSAAWRSWSARSRSSTRCRSRSPSARGSSGCCGWSAPAAARCSARSCSRR